MKLRSVCVWVLMCAACNPRVDLGENPDAAGGGAGALGGGSSQTGGGGGGVEASGGGDSAQGGGGSSALGGGMADMGGGAGGGATAMGGGTAASGGGGGSAEALVGWCSDAGWCFENPIPFGVDLNSVWAVSEAEAWFVGDRGVTLHFKDGAFTWVPDGYQQALSGVSAAGPNDVWAVGPLNTIQHWDGQQWADAGPAPMLGGYPEAFISVWAYDAAHVWVGTQGSGLQEDAILFFDGGTWTKVAFDIGLIPTIWGTSPDDVWFSDDLKHFDGTSLTTGVVHSPFEADYGMWGSSPTSYWAGGVNAALGHFDGTAWDVVATPGAIHSIWGSGDDNIWAVGKAGADAGRFWQHAGSDLMHGVSTAWTAQAAPTDRTLMAVHGTSASNVWVAGAGGTVLHNDGGTWTRVLPRAAVTTSALYSVWGSSATDVYAVGPDAGLLHNDGTGWTQSVITPGQLVDVRGTGPNDVWVTGPTDTLHFDGHAWSDRGAGLDAGLIGLWTRTADDVWGGSVDGTLYRWQSATGWQWQYKIPFLDLYQPTSTIAIWGSGPDDIYAGGGGGHIAHFDGGTWGDPPSKMSLGTGFDIHTLNHVWGTAKNNVYLDVGNGFFCLWDGSGVWQYIPTVGGSSTLGIDGTGPNDVWTVDRYFSRALHWDGTAWSEWRLPSTNIYGFGVTDAHHLWAVGDNGQILRLVH